MKMLKLLLAAGRSACLRTYGFLLLQFFFSLQLSAQTVRWNFDNYPEFSLFVHKVIENQCIKFKWENTHVAFSFRPKGESITEVTIETTGYEVSQAGLDSSYSESEGWTDFMWRLRLYLENNWTYETLQKSVQP